MKKLIFSLLLWLGSNAMAQNNFYVSPNGNDMNAGSMEQPFKTIQRSLDAAKNLKGENCIYLMEGVYRISSPLVINGDHGNDSASLTLRSYPGQKASLTSAIKINSKWKRFKGNIYKLHLPEIESMDMLLVDGNIRPMARYPNYDPAAIRFNGTSADATSPQRVRGWKNPKGGFLHAMHAHDWGDFHYQIDGKSNDSTLVLSGGHQNNRKMGLSNENRMVENIFEELDAPGEWFFDSDCRILYYYPIEGEDINSIELEAPTSLSLIKIIGSEESPAKNITIKGLDFYGCKRSFMEEYEQLLRSDWCVYRGGALYLENTGNCHIVECDFRNLGGNGIFVSRKNRDAFIAHNHLKDIGASAILFVGDISAVKSPSLEYWEYVPIDSIDFSEGPANDQYPSDCIVYDNLIHHIGVYEKQITGVELSMSTRITVSHCTIHDVPRAGINVSEGTWGGHVIELNDVFNTVRETGDHGSFNSWGRDRYWHPDYQEMCRIAEKYPDLALADANATTIIRNNRFRCDRGWDIDLDDGSSNYHIYNNLCLNGGLKLREGFFRKVENNILVNNTFHPHVWFANSGDVFVNNIVMSPYQPIGIKQWGSMVDFNVFSDHKSLAEAQKNHTDANSIVAALDFTDPANGDYSLKDSGCELSRIGFHNFDMNNFGVVSKRLKEKASSPNFSLPIINKDAEGDSYAMFKGFRMKSLDTLGELSATGLDSMHGVFVISSGAYDSPVRDYLMANDVIISINGIQINDFEHMKETISSLSDNTNAEMEIFRDHKYIKELIKSELLKSNSR